MYILYSISKNMSSEQLNQYNRKENKENQSFLTYREEIQSLKNEVENSSIKDKANSNTHIEDKKIEQNNTSIEDKAKIQNIVELLRNRNYTIDPQEKQDISEQEIKNNFINYILDWKLWSWDDPEMEEIYYKISFLKQPYYISTNTPNIKPSTRKLGLEDPFARPLKYIKDNAWKNIHLILNELEEKKNSSQKQTEKTIEITEEETILPKFIKNLFSRWYKIILKWSDIISESTQGVTEHIWERIDNVFRFFKNFSEIKSAPRKYNNRWISLCSYTAQLNAKNFGINIPNGNAKAWVHKQPIDSDHFISSYTKSWNNNSCIDITNVAPQNANVADISVESDTRMWRIYWHRAFAFKNNDGTRFILDPYYSWWKWIKPIPYDSYPKNKRIEMVNYYNSPVQSVAA